MNLIITEKGNGIATEYRFNKDFDTWKALPKKVTLPKKVKVVTEEGNESLPYSGHSKETTKETYQKKDYVPRSSEHRPDPRVSEILKFYGEEYKRLLGVSPKIVRGKDGSLAKQLIALLETDHPGESVSRARGLITKFLTTSDDFTRKTGKDFGVFFSQLNKLRTGSVSGVVDNSKIDFPRVSGYVTL